MTTPTFTTSKGALDKAAVDLVVVGATIDGDDFVLDDAAGVLGDELHAALERVGFTAKAGTTARLPLFEARGRSLLAVGLGEDGDDLDARRRAAAAAVQAATGVTSIATSLATDRASAQAVVEGVLLASYAFDEFLSDEGRKQRELPTVTKVALHGTGAPKEVKAGVADGEHTAGAARLVRDLVNTPPHAKRPPALAKRAQELAKGTGLKVKVLDDQQLAKGGYGGLIGVGQGSAEGPRLVELTWAPKGATGHVALVGKGITFDTGGISIKPSQAMTTMKMDMAGAASVLGVMLAVARMELPLRVTGIMALAENMPSGTATRPSDVLTMRSGATVEVLNTDAEGRLVLADALDHAAEAGPDCIVDMATLTGAVIVALGPRIGALMSTDDQLAEELLAASERVAEPLARLPLGKELYAKDMESDTADIKNAYMGDGAGTIKAGLFLEHFVPEDIPWAHLDIAGVAWANNAEGYLTKGGTGVPVRLLLDWLRQRAAA